MRNLLERDGTGAETLLLVLLAAGLQPATAFGLDGDGETTFAVPLWERRPPVSCSQRLV